MRRPRGGLRVTWFAFLQLCRELWPPLFHLLRRSGALRSPGAAQARSARSGVSFDAHLGSGSGATTARQTDPRPHPVGRHHMRCPAVAAMFRRRRVRVRTVSKIFEVSIRSRRSHGPVACRGPVPPAGWSSGLVPLPAIGGRDVCYAGGPVRRPGRRCGPAANGALALVPGPLRPRCRGAYPGSGPGVILRPGTTRRPGQAAAAGSGSSSGPGTSAKLRAAMTERGIPFQAGSHQAINGCSRLIGESTPSCHGRNPVSTPRRFSRCRYGRAVVTGPLRFPGR